MSNADYRVEVMLQEELKRVHKLVDEAESLLFAADAWMERNHAISTAQGDERRHIRHTIWIWQQKYASVHESSHDN